MRPRPDTGHDALEAMTHRAASALRRAQGLLRRASPQHPGIGHPNLTVGLISGRHQHQCRARQGDDPPRPPRSPRKKTRRRWKRICASSSRGASRDFRGHPRRDRAGPARLAASPASRRGGADRADSAATARRSWAKRRRSRACRSTPMRGSTRRRAFRPSPTAPARAPSWRQTATAPTRS